MVYFFDSNHSDPKAIAKYTATWKDGTGQIHKTILPDAETSNQGEWEALIQVLAHIYDQARKGIVDHTPSIYGDSLLVINQMSGQWKVKNEALQDLWHTAHDILYVLNTKFQIVVTFFWIPRKENNKALGLK